MNLNFDYARREKTWTLNGSAGSIWKWALD